MLLTFALAAMACARDYEVKPRRYAEPMQEHLTLEYRACTNDTDCVLALNGCCDCANGGEDIAVNREQAAAFKARFVCNHGCTEIGGNCGQGTIACEAKLCVYHQPP